MTSTTPFPLALLCLSALTLLTACDAPADANRDNFSKAVTAYLAKQGDLCLAKTDWPIDVSQREIDAGARNAVQMPVLERLGLVRSAPATVQLKDEDTTTSVPVRRYTLTDAGRAYYRPHGRSGRSDFCAAHLSLDKVVGWDTPPTGTTDRQALVTYTYRVDPAPWTRDPEVAKVFPMVDRIVRGAGHEQLTQGFTLTAGGWVAQGS
jgi:hypothetical protein